MKTMFEHLTLRGIPHDAASDAAAAATAAAAAAAASQGEPWFKGADPEVLGHITNRGWDKKTAPEVAFEAIKSHREAEKLIGAPATELIRLPKEVKDEAGWNAVWNRLGKPKEAAEYDFANVKDAAGKPLADPLVASLRAAAFANHLTKDAAVGVANAVVRANAEAAKEADAVKAAAVLVEKQALQKNWGQNFETNKFVAGNAVASLGIDRSVVDLLEGQIGYAKTMDMFLNIGRKIGEGRFVTNEDKDNPTTMTREGAAARVSELKADPDWSAKYLAGDAAKVREMGALMLIIAGGDDSENSRFASARNR